MNTCLPILKLASVAELTTLSPASIYRLIKAGNFPKPFKLSLRASGWYAAEIAAWVNSRREGAADETRFAHEQYHPDRFADPRSLFEFALWSNVDFKSSPLISAAIRTLSEVARDFEKQILKHENNVALGAQPPMPMHYSEERQLEHSAILSRASSAWRAYRASDEEGSEKAFLNVWQPLLEASRAWVDINDIAMLKIVLGHILEIISIAEHRIKILADRRATDKQNP